jgi:von Willebrand factor type A domain
MSASLFGSRSLLAAAADDALRTVEFDWPGTALHWAAAVGVVLAILALVISVYRRDTRESGRAWQYVLTGLRLAVIGILIAIAVNPQERTRQIAYRPSRVAVLIDTSLSMRFPEAVANQSEGAVTRADAVRDLMTRSPLMAELRKQQNVRIYTFDSALTGPQAVYPSQAERSEAATLGAGRPTDTATVEGENGKQAPGDKAASTAGAADRKGPVDWNEIVRPRGLETRLGEALNEAVRQFGGRTLSGIVVISDGNSNAGIEPSTAQEVAKRANVRLFTVGVGSTEQPVNLQVVSIQAPSDVHLNDPYDFSAFVQGFGLKGRTVTVDLLVRPEGDEKAQPKVIETREITIREDGSPVEVKFRQTPTVAGGFEFFVRAKSPAGVREISYEDNERRKTVNVIDRKLHVLLIAGGPMRDYRFLHTMLNRHSSIDVDVWLQTVSAVTASQVSQDAKRLLVDFPRTPSELLDYDVVVAFDPDWSRIPPEGRKLLVNWVSEHSGGLILVAGDIFTPQLAAPNNDLDSIKELYPVFLSSAIQDLSLDAKADQPWPVALTEAGKQAGFLQLVETSFDLAATWKQFPGVYRCYPTAGAKAGATVYANFSDPRAQNEHGQPILFAAEFYGSGRTFYIGSPELWRLRAVDEEYYDRFWTKVIREVGQGRLRRGTARGLLLLERSQYALGQTIRVRANLLDPQLLPLDVPSVELNVFDPHGVPLTEPRILKRDRDRPGQYWADFRASLPGTYRILVRPQVDDEKQNLSAKIDVILPNLEFDNPRQNAKLLADLARETGGKYLTLESAAAELPSLLQDRGERFAVDEQLRALWDRQWVLYLLVGLLGLEWLTRKLLRLA